MVRNQLMVLWVQFPVHAKYQLTYCEMHVLAMHGWKTENMYGTFISINDTY